MCSKAMGQRFCSNRLYRDKQNGWAWNDLQTVSHLNTGIEMDMVGEALTTLKKSLEG
jgi:hypothetical protein